VPVDEALWGLGCSLAAVVAALGVAAVAAARGHRWWPSDDAPALGMLLVAGALAAMTRTRELTPEMLVGLIGIAAVSRGVGASGFQGWRCPPARAPLAAAPFAWLLAVDASSVGWVRALVFGVIAVGCVAAARTETEWGATGLTPVLYGLAAAGVFGAVPDTEEAAALLGASVPVALLAWPLGRARLGSAGAGTATALLVWVVAIGGRGRTPSVVGAAACLGLLVSLSVGAWLARRWAGRPHETIRSPAVPSPWPPELRPSEALALVASHAGLVAVASRVAGISPHLWVAVPVALAATAAAVGVGVRLARQRPSTTAEPRALTGGPAGARRP